MASQPNDVVTEYKTAIQDLTFNSKPLINALTMLAEDNKDFGSNIIKVICDRIMEVDVTKKMPSLYLLDSILKNVGNEYIQVISMVIAETFCHVFESAVDERNRLSLFKLRKTWTQYFPSKILHAIDVRSSKTDPNWPIMANSNGNASQQVEQQNKIHVNPKFLQQSNTGTTKVNDYNGNAQELSSQGGNFKDSAKLEKMRKEREQHEQHLKQKQIERERVLADQKRQIELLRKQQQIQQEKPLQVSTTPTPTSKTVKDPRLRTASPVPPNNSLKKDAFPTDSNTHATKLLSPKGSRKGKALSVVNKIVKLAVKKPKQAKKSSSTTQSSKITSHSNDMDTSSTGQPVKNWDGTLQSSRNANTSAKVNSNTTPPVVKKEDKVSEKPNVVPSLLPPPFSPDFSGLSSKDMQIAAQAAAIATAMHQMQSVVKGPIAPEQSAQLAAQFIKMLQSSAPGTTTSTVVTVGNESSLSSNQIKTNSTATVHSTSSSAKVQEKVKESGKTETSKSDNHSNKNQTKVFDSRKTQNDSKSNFSKSVSDKSKSVPKATGPVDKDSKSEKLSKSLNVRDKTRDRKERSDKYEPPSKKSKDSAESNDRPRKARARSPSRYYCQVEQKQDTEKKVEENKKELNLQRERKFSESDEHLDEKTKEQKKIYQSYLTHIEALEKRFEQPNSKISVQTLESVLKQFEMKYKKRMMSTEQYNNLADLLDKFATRISGCDTKVANRRLQFDETFSPKKNKNNGQPLFRNDARPIARPDGRPVGQDGPFPPRGFVPHIRGQRFMRQPPPNWRGPPPGHFHERFPPHHFRNVPPHMMMDGPPLDQIRRPHFHMDHDGMIPPPHPMGMHPPQNNMERLPPPNFHEMPPNHGQPPLPPQPTHWDVPPVDYRQQPQWRDSPPPRMPEGPPGVPLQMPPMQQPPHSNSPIPGFSEQPPPELIAPKPNLDVNNLLGKLMASGLIGTVPASSGTPIASAEDRDENVPEMPFRIEELKKRKNVLVRQLFLGMQCSSCGERFPKSHKKQYSDHLDWHFRENKKEKEGGKKVMSRSWYFELSDWVEFSERKVGDDGKVQSAFFESEKGEESDHIRKPSNRVNTVQSVPVEGDEGDGVCGVCMDTLEEYWDEDLEEWRYKNAVRKGNKTYHVACQDCIQENDELDETVTPVATPIVEKSFALADDSSERLVPPDDSEDIVPPGTESEIAAAIVPPGTESDQSQAGDDIDSSILKDDIPETEKLVIDEPQDGKIAQNENVVLPVPSLNVPGNDSDLSLSIDAISPSILPPGMEGELSPTDNDIVPPGTENESEEPIHFKAIKEEDVKMEVDLIPEKTCDIVISEVENIDTDKDNQVTNDIKVKVEPMDDDYIADSPEYPLIPSSERISSTDES